MRHNEQFGQENNVVKRSHRRHSVHGVGYKMSSSGSKAVSDLDLMRDILFAFQGLSGKILIQDPDNDNRYTLAPGYSLNPSVREFALRLTNLGWLFHRVNTFCQNTAKDQNAHGLVYQSFAAVLSEEIVEYYRMIAIIEQQLHFMAEPGASPDTAPTVSLHRLQVWTMDHLHRLKMLAILIEECRKRRGGGLARVVYKRLQTGDPALKNCLTRILNQVVLPIRKMLSKWIFHGQIDDPYKEFFIIASSHSDGTSVENPSSQRYTSGIDSLWHEKYSINEAMLPGFIPMRVAKTILATGKAVNLLLQSSGDRLDVPGYDDLREAFERTNIESLFREATTESTSFRAGSPSTPSSSSVSGSTGDFRYLLHKAYKEVSAKAINILLEDHNLMSHLIGLRQFLLLGQGDFIRHLMDLMGKELDKPALRLHAHALTCLLRQTIRATNAQYMPDEVLNRLDCLLVTKADEATGWDVFSLSYDTRGPIGTILTPECMKKYSILFQHLWRSKRIEYILTGMKKEQMSNSQAFAKVLPILQPIFYRNHFLLQEMINFIQQIQYYIEFEVIECSWAEFVSRVKEAQDIDQLVESHNSFLSHIMSRALLDEESADLCDNLRAIYEAVIAFRDTLVSFNKIVEREVRVNEKQQLDLQSVHASNLSLASALSTASSSRQDLENEVIPSYQAKFNIQASTYHDMVQNFLLLLAQHHEDDLHFLNTRIDFNEYYLRRNKSLETSFTFSHHRLSFDTSK